MSPGQRQASCAVTLLEEDAASAVQAGKGRRGGSSGRPERTPWRELLQSTVSGAGLGECCLPACGLLFFPGHVLKGTMEQVPRVRVELGFCQAGSLVGVSSQRGALRGAQRPTKKQKGEGVGGGLRARAPGHTLAGQGKPCLTR